MAAKIKLLGAICTAEDGVWTCPDKVVLRFVKDTQNDIDLQDKAPALYSPSLDNTMAMEVAKRTNAEIVSLGETPDSGEDEARVY